MRHRRFLADGHRQLLADEHEHEQQRPLRNLYRSTPTAPTGLAARDRRLKRDIARLAELANGLGVYHFRYLWSDDVFVGVVVQEALGVRPEAVVTGQDGFIRVIYRRPAAKCCPRDSGSHVLRLVLRQRMRCARTVDRLRLAIA
ncbi:tail fiber domain-containing protein [Sinorhizobium medicae]|uniref:tail fiber domain-containing protein n=1 Tax=Sinorhizobium medicae TaxID=110321 RepID=UPI003B51A84E